MSKRIIITGNIGTGKSTVTKILEEAGFETISADKINKKILENKQIEIENLFDMKKTTFDIFKQSLGKLVFENNDIKQRLETLLLPLIYKKIEEEATIHEENKSHFISELPTFFENNGLKKNNSLFIINVITLKEIRISRIMSRNKKLSRTDVLNRINSQINSFDKIQYSSITIDNSNSYEDLKDTVISLLPLLKSLN